MEILFIFQSYNLITHQTVLANVELALTISGVSKSERRKRAVEALERWGWEISYTKSPTRCQAVRCSELPLPVPLSITRIYSLPMSLQAHLTVRPAFR